MGRPRRQPERQEPEAEAPSAPEPEPAPASDEIPAEPKTVSLTYIGPPDQMVAGLGYKLETGESYDVPEEMAAGLLASELHWEK